MQARQAYATAAVQRMGRAGMLNLEPHHDHDHDHDHAKLSKYQEYSGVCGQSLSMLRSTAGHTRLHSMHHVEAAAAGRDPDWFNVCCWSIVSTSMTRMTA